MDDEEENKLIRLVLRRPQAEAQIADLEATPQSFDTLFNKPYYAHQLRLAGHDWPEIARRLHYRSAYGAEQAVRTWLRRDVESRAKNFPQTAAALHQEAVGNELARLDKLQAAYWDQAIGGDVPSALFCLRVIAQRAKLLGLETPHAEITTNVNTLLVGGSEADYVSALLRARDSVGNGPAPRVIEPDDQPGMVD